MWFAETKSPLQVHRKFCAKFVRRLKDASTRDAEARKKLEAEANLEATNFIRSEKRKQNIFYCFHIPGINKENNYLSCKISRA